MKPVHALLFSSVLALPAFIQARATTEKKVETTVALDVSNTPSGLFASRPHVDYGPNIMVSLTLNPSSQELQTQGFLLAALPCDEYPSLLSELTSGEMISIQDTELPESIRATTAQKLYGLRDNKVVCQGELC